jgi:predicted nucleotidyltransferase
MMEKKYLKKLFIELKLKEEEIINIYITGSRVYGTFNSNSDYDLVILIKNNEENKETEMKNQYSNINIDNEIKFDIDVFNEYTFLKELNNFYIKILECISLQQKDYEKYIIIYNKKYDHPNYDSYQFRKSIRKLTSNSFVKFKKKMLVEKDSEYIGRVKNYY